tara:strand:- start:1516 stop:1728 length:213 start_codon:yes stop_codon:yes gene_type:complete
MAKTYMVLFSTGDGDFTQYTKSEWETEVDGWKTELRDAGYGLYHKIDSLDDYDVVEAMGGDEWFITRIEG